MNKILIPLLTSLLTFSAYADIEGRYDDGARWAFISDDDSKTSPLLTPLRFPTQTRSNSRQNRFILKCQTYKTFSFTLTDKLQPSMSTT